MTIAKVTSCTGCAACANACPARAISMREDETGYYHPVIAAETCTECGLCATLCPEITPVPFQSGTQSCFVVQADNDLRFVSSSGGAFSLIVEEWFRRHKGKEVYVAGAAFDDSWNVHHILIDDLRELDRLRRSKYVQSFIAEDAYRTIKELLEKGAYLVFSGCPCQVAGLRSFLRKTYDNLLLVDLFCAQIASPKVYRKFLEDACAGEILSSVNFRSKIRGWTTCTTLSTDKHPEEVPTERFMQAYGLGLLKNTPCMHCQYHALHRQGDISIGDFWGVDPHFDDNRGTSCVLTNTSRGKDIVLSFKSRCKIHEQRSITEAVRGQSCLREDTPAHRNRDLFNKHIDKLGFNESLSRIVNNTYDVAVMGCFWNVNEGSILTNYALNEAIASLGYTCQTLNFIPNVLKDAYKGSISEKFAQKYLRLTEKVDEDSLDTLNDSFGTFVVGSDQLWRWDFRTHFRRMFLSFVNAKNKKISYSTSFGAEVSFEGPEEQRRLRKLWLSRFDAISVREYEGVTLLKKDFDLEGTQVVDPVFLLDKSAYENIAAGSQCTEKDFIAYYIFHQTEANMEIVREAERHYHTVSIDITNKLPVEDWLYYIKNCTMLITDSFHGSCFATIFNKNFISIAVKERSNRFTTLFSITGMLDHFLFDPSEFDRKREYLFQDIDWTEANARLRKEIACSRAWLKEALEKPRREPSETAELLNTMSVELERTRYQLQRASAMNRKNTLLIKYWICRLANAIRRTYADNVLYYKQRLAILHDVPDDRLLPWIYTKIVKRIVRKCKNTLVCRTKNLLRGTRDR